MEMNLEYSILYENELSQPLDQLVFQNLLRLVMKVRRLILCMITREDLKKLLG
jgi:hypothetical protein